MDIENLKSAWQKYSSTNDNKIIVPEDVEKMLNKRTLGITEKIRRNIIVGLAIVLVWIGANIVVSIFTSPFLDKYFDKGYVETEFFTFTFIFELIIYVAIIASIVVFWKRYNKIEKQYQNNGLKQKITRLISILNSYRKLFYLITIVVLIYIFVAFTSGFILGYTYETAQLQGEQSMQAAEWIFIVPIFIISAGLIILIYYFLFNLFFKRLYGKYLVQLKETLAELDEPLNDAEQQGLE